MKNGMMMGANCTSWLMNKFLGVVLLGVGAKMLLSYGATAQWMMGTTEKFGFPEGFSPIFNVVGQLVSYTWPIAAALIGLSLLACYKKCLAKTVLVVYLALFALAHLWSGDLVAASWDLLVMIFIGVARAVSLSEPKK